LIELHLLGGLTLEAPDLSPTSVARRRHPQALLSILAASAPRAVGRERITALLWPDGPPSRAGNSLRQVLHRLRRDLGEEIFLPESAGGLQLDPDRFTIDLWTFRDAVAAGALDRAVEAYRGPFLDGFRMPGLDDFNRWVEAEREKWARVYLEALDTLARTAEEEGRFADAVSWRRKQAATDPYSSRLALALLRTLTAAGDRIGALKQAGIHEALVREHLGTEPDPEVLEFVAVLREEVAAPADASSSATDAGGPEKPVTPPAAATATPRAAATAARPVTETATPAGLAGLWVRVGRWAGVLAVLVLAVVGARSLLLDGRPATRAPAAPSNLVVLGSAITSVDGRDPSNRIVACDGPACPDGALPQPAYVVAKHPAYGSPVAGTGYVSSVPDGTTRAPPGFECCTTVTFENAFELPEEAAVGRISLSVLADNRATVSVNGVEFGRQQEPEATSNFAGPASNFTVAFPPDPGGTNRLRVTLWNAGGALALQYHAVVTYEASSDMDRDGVEDPVDAFPDSDLRPTLVIGSCDTGVANRTLAEPPGATFGDLVGRAAGPNGLPEERVAEVLSLARHWRDAGLIGESDLHRIQACTATGAGGR